MIDPEQRRAARRSANRFLVAGVVMAGIGYLPLQLYILFGPRDGNPIGLGLLAALAMLAGLAVSAAGLVKLAIHYFLSRKG